MKKKKKVRKPGHDAPKPGYRRWTVHVPITLLKDFYDVARKEKKTVAAATEEAINNWLGYE